MGISWWFKGISGDLRDFMVVEWGFHGDLRELVVI